MQFSIIQRTVLLFAFLMLVLALNGLFSYRAISQLVESEKLLAHSYTVLSAIDALEFRVQDSHTSADDFVITGRPENLAAFQDYISQVDAKLELLRRLTANDSTQQSLIASATSRIEDLEQFLRNAVEARQQSRAVQPPTGEKLQAAMNAIGQMKTHESGLVQSRSAKAASTLRAALGALLVGCVGTLVLLGLAGYLIVKGERERNAAQESQRQLSARILSAQDEERRRIAREIHDSTVQKLALLSMNLSQLQKLSDPQKIQSVVQKSQDLSNQCAQELRSLSYLLHPPMLEELGLASALKIYAEGFSQRSGIKLELDVPPDFERLPHEMEMALFRVAQESLSNILRHSNSPWAKIKLASNGAIELAVVDRGQGFAAGRNPGADNEAGMGVGILGMRERMKQLGGTLRIESGPGGTSVSAHLPYRRRVDEQNPNRDRR